MIQLSPPYQIANILLAVVGCSLSYDHGGIYSCPLTAIPLLILRKEVRITRERALVGTGNVDVHLELCWRIRPVATMTMARAYCTMRRSSGLRMDKSLTTAAG